MLFTGSSLVPWQLPSARLLLGLLVFIFATSTVSILILLRALSISQRSLVPKCRRKHTRTHLLVVLGSGGHTAEMFSMLRCMPLDPTLYKYRTYVVSSGDSFSARKATEFEASLLEQRTEDSTEERGRHVTKVTTSLGTDAVSKPYSSSSRPDSGSYSIVTVPRARRVHQSFLTAPLSTLQCFWACLSVLRGVHPEQSQSWRTTVPPYPDIILTNGPATAVCVILAAKLLRLLDFTLLRFTGRPLGTGHRDRSDSGKQRPQPLRLRTIFVESWARVTTLSLSGKILLPFVDRFLVQWPGLAGRRAWKGMKETEYVGALVY